METEQLKNKIGNAAKWSSITEISAKIITPITNMLLARLLAPEAFGVVATIVMIISFTDMFTDAGFQKYLIQHEFKNKKEKKRSIDVAFWTNFITSLLLWILIIVFKDGIATIVGSPDKGNVIAIACMQLPIMSFSSIQMALYRRDFNFKTLFMVRIVAAFVPLLISVPLAIMGFSYWALIIGTLFGASINAIILTLKSNWRPSFFYDFQLLKKMFSFSLWTLLESVAIWLGFWIDALIIGNAFSEYYLGLYKNSLNMVNSLMAIVSASVIPVLFSSLSRLQDNDNAFQQLYYTTQRYVSYILFPMGLGLFLYSELATNIMLGSNWLEASDIVGIWSLMAVVGIVFSNFNGEVYRAKGRPKLSFVYQVIHLCFLVPGILIAKDYGFWVLVFTRSLLRLQGTVTGFIFMKLFMDFSFRDMIRNVIKPICCTILMGAFVIMLKNIYDSLWWNLLSIFIAIIVYIVLLLLFSKKDVIRMLHQLKRR